MQNSVAQFIQFLRIERRYSDHTTLAYQSDLLQFLHFAQVHSWGENLDVFSHKCIRAWLVLLAANGAQAASLRRKISSLQSFVKWAINKGIYTQPNPFLKITIPKSGKRLPAIFKESELKKMLDLGSSDEFDDTRNNLIMNLLYQCGLRRSELIALKEENIDFFRMTIKVKGKGNKERIIPILDELILKVRRYLEVRNKLDVLREDRLIILKNGKAMYPEAVYRLVKTLAGTYSTIHRTSPHILRHSFASHLLDNGAELNVVKSLLGHASLASTQVYTHSSIEKLKEIYMKAHPKASF